MSYYVQLNRSFSKRKSVGHVLVWSGLVLVGHPVNTLKSVPSVVLDTCNFTQPIRLFYFKALILDECDLQHFKPFH